MTRDRRGAADAILAALLFIAAVAYLASFPRSLNPADESYFLYESARIRNGEVMYRDIFQFITPLASYVMAFLFWAFGTRIGTAHAATAVLHGLSVVLLFLICRRLDVRRELAVVTGIAYLGVCQSTWPVASPHWFSTHFVLWIVLALVGARWYERPSASILAGIATGVLIGVQQQKGVAMAAGVVGIFAFDYLVSARFSDRPPARLFLQRLTYFAGGMLAIVVPLLVVCVAMAGVEPVFEALVRFPLFSYPNTLGVRWGGLGFLAKSFGEYTFPTFLRWIPLVLVVAVARWCWSAVFATNRHRQRMLSVLIGAAAASVFSILYYPDVIHIAFIAPVLLVCIAESVQWALNLAVSSRGWAMGAAQILAIGTVLLLVPHMARTFSTRWRLYHVPHDTAFGRIDFPSPLEPALTDEVRRVLEDVPGREIYAYPNFSSIYLTAAANNPTPYQFFNASQSPPEQTSAVLSILRQRSLPYIVGVTIFMKPDDPVVRYISENYELVDLPGLDSSKIPLLLLYRRKDLGGT